jgi:glycosyltransferase involved in cell wall biosynthesis
MSSSDAMPRVSVGLPVYNGERYLAEALDSLLAQEFTDFELVIGDNCSTDATAEICRSYAADDARICYLRSDVNRGAAWNYNRVFHASRGGYFRWAAYDDVVAPTHLGRCVETLDASGPDVALAYTQTTLIDEHGTPAGDYDEPFDAAAARASVRVAQIVRHIVLSNVFFGLLRREVMEKTHLHGAYPSADWALILEWAMQGRFVQVPERLFYRRLHPGMSRAANRDTSAVAEWFEPGSGRTVRPEFFRLFGEMCKAIGRAPVGYGTRVAVAATFVPQYLARHRRALMLETGAMLTRRGE